MKARISTIMKTTKNQMWRELQKVSSLLYVAAPILKFTPQKSSLPEEWSLGKEYNLKLWLFGIIPLGDHFIKLVELNRDENRIVSNEYGRLAKTWNHTITFNAIDNQTLAYTDEIEIEAGMMTLGVWLFAQVFYRHRQNRWKKRLAGQPIASAEGRISRR